MWEVVVAVLGAALIAVVGWLGKRMIDGRDKLSRKLDAHEAECHKHWKENSAVLAVHGEKLANLEKGQDKLEKGQEKMNAKLDRILETRPVVP